MPLMPEFDRVGVLAGSVARAARIASLMAGRELRPRAGGQVGRQMPDDLAALRRAALLLVEVEAARLHAALLDDPDSKISSPLRAALRFGRNASPERIAKANARIAETRRWLDEQFRHCDVLILPTTPGPAFAFDQPGPESQADYTVLANIAGLAAISVPGDTVDGLPVGMQAIGRDDALVLGVAAGLA
jgi:aspartyl-tRNA(Asn)/glutamyl-tRNA(Gln) amidotransferase subunit A